MRSVGREVAFNEWGDSRRFIESGRALKNSGTFNLRRD
jgi:hypothetical protein